MIAWTHHLYPPRGTPVRADPAAPVGYYPSYPHYEGCSNPGQVSNCYDHSLSYHAVPAKSIVCRHAPYEAPAASEAPPASQSYYAPPSVAQYTTATTTQQPGPAPRTSAHEQNPHYASTSSRPLSPAPWHSAAPAYDPNHGAKDEIQAEPRPADADSHALVPYQTTQEDLPIAYGTPVNEPLKMLENGEAHDKYAVQELSLVLAEEPRRNPEYPGFPPGVSPQSYVEEADRLKEIMGVTKVVTYVPAEDLHKLTGAQNEKLHELERRTKTRIFIQNSSKASEPSAVTIEGAAYAVSAALICTFNMLAD